MGFREPCFNLVFEIQGHSDLTRVTDTPIALLNLKPPRGNLRIQKELGGASLERLPLLIQGQAENVHIQIAEMPPPIEDFISLYLPLFRFLRCRPLLSLFLCHYSLISHDFDDVFLGEGNYWRSLYCLQTVFWTQRHMSLDATPSRVIHQQPIPLPSH